MIYNDPAAVEWLEDNPHTGDYYSRPLFLKLLDDNGRRVAAMTVVSHWQATDMSADWKALY